MTDPRFNRRRVLQISVGGALAATLSLPVGRWAGAQDAPVLTYKGDLEFWDWQFEPRQAAEDAILADWKQRYPDINLSYQVLPYGDAQTKLLTAASAGQEPPFANVHAFWRVELQRAGVLVPYPADLFNYDELVSTQFNREPGTGNIYTSTFCFYTDQIYFNTKLLAEQGITPEQVPTKWDDFLKMAQQLAKWDGDRMVQAGWSFNHYYSQEWLWATMIYQQGGFLYSEDGTKALWDSDEAVTALQLISDVYHTYKADDPNFLGMFDAFGGGVAATYISQGYTGAGWTKTEYPDLEWGTAPTPTFTGSATPSWGLMTPEEGFCVFTKATPEQQAVAFEFIKELVGTDEQRIKWALINNGPPDKPSLADAPEIKQNEMGNSITTQAVTLPYRINYGERPLEAEAIWRQMFDDVILNGVDAKTAATTAATNMTAALASSGKQRFFTERQYKAPSGSATPTA